MATQGGLASNLDLRALAGVLERATSPSIQERLMSTPAVITSLTHPVKPMDSPTTIGDSDDPISTRRARKRADVKNLHRVLQEEERQALELRAALKHAGERLTTESERTNEMERRLVEYEKRERSLARARRRAESLAVRADAEAKAYKLHLELANRENAKAQQAVDALAKDRTEAEEAAARARSTARRLQEKLIFERARQLGRQEGLQDGLKQGFDEGLDIGWQEGRDDGYDEMRSRALLAFEEALKSGAIQSTADFDLNAAIKSERAKLRAIAAARPTRRTSLRPLTSRGSNYNSSLRVKSPELMQDAIDSGPMPFPTPRTKDEMPLAPPPEIQVIATTPPATTIDPSQRAIVPRSSFQGMPVVNHPPVDPIPDGFVPTIGANGKFVLPPPHEIGPSPVPSRTPSPSAANIPLPNSAYAPSTTSHDPLNARSPPVRRKSIGAENRAFEEAARLRREKEIAEQGYAELMEELERERAQREAERKKREEDERERDAQRRRERELELALERTREEEREAERERIRSLEKKNELARAQELERERQERERERQERLRAEEESRQKDAEARRKLAEKDAELDRLKAAQAEALAQAAQAATVAATAHKKPSTNDSNEQERNITSYDDEGGGSSEDEEDPTTDEHVRIPYRPKKLMRARKRNGKGSVHSVTTHKTAGGMSTPLSSFSVLAPAEEAQRRKDEAVRDRRATLERLEQREKAEREAQERERAATLKSVKRNLSIIREQPSTSDITAPVRNSSEQAQPAAPQTPHPSLPILPVRLDRGPPENSPFMRPQVNLPSEASGQTVGENVRRTEQDPSKPPKPRPQTTVPAPLAPQQNTNSWSNAARGVGSSPALPALPIDGQSSITYGGASPRQSPLDRVASLVKGANPDNAGIIIPDSPTSIRDGNPPMIPTIQVERPSRESSETFEMRTEHKFLPPEDAKRPIELPSGHPPPPARSILKNPSGSGTFQPIIPTPASEIPVIPNSTITPITPVSPFTRTAQIPQSTSPHQPTMDRTTTASPLRRTGGGTSYHPPANTSSQAQAPKPIIPILPTKGNGTSSPVSSIAEPVLPDMFPTGEVKRRMARPIGYKPPEQSHSLGSPMRILPRTADWTKPGPTIEPDVPSSHFATMPEIQPITADAGSTPFAPPAVVREPTPALSMKSPWIQPKDLSKDGGIVPATSRTLPAKSPWLRTIDISKTPTGIIPVGFGGADSSIGQQIATQPTPALTTKSPWVHAREFGKDGGPASASPVPVLPTTSPWVSTIDVAKPTVGIIPAGPEGADGSTAHQLPARMLRPSHSRVDEAPVVPAPIIPAAEGPTRMQRPLTAQVAPAAEPPVPIFPDGRGEQLVSRTPKMQRPTASQVTPSFSELPKAAPVLPPQTPGKMLRPGMRPPTPPLIPIGGPPPVVELSYTPNITAATAPLRSHPLPTTPIVPHGPAPMARPVNGTTRAFDFSSGPASHTPPDASRTGPALRRTALPTFTPGPNMQHLPGNNQLNSSFPLWQSQKGGPSPVIPTLQVTAPSPQSSAKNSSTKEKKKPPKSIVVNNKPQPWPMPPSATSALGNSTSSAPPKSPMRQPPVSAPILPHTASSTTDEPNIAQIIPSWGAVASSSNMWGTTGPSVSAAPKSPAKIPPDVRPIIPFGAVSSGDERASLWGSAEPWGEKLPRNASPKSVKTNARSIKSYPRKASVSTVSDEGSPPWAFHGEEQVGW